MGLRSFMVESQWWSDGEKMQGPGVEVEVELPKIRAKPVLCIETGIVYYGGAEEAAREMGVKHTSIQRACTQKNATCRGFHWKYVKNIFISDRLT